MICLVVLSVLAPSSLQTFQKEHFRFDICTIVLRAINTTKVVNLKWPFTQRGVYVVCMPRKEKPNGWSSRPTDASHMIVSSTIGISHWDKCEKHYWDTLLGYFQNQKPLVNTLTHPRPPPSRWKKHLA